MKKIILALLFLMSVILVSNEGTYYYGIKNTEITGKLIRKKIKNPAGYNRNAVIYPYFIVLDTPVDVVKSGNTEVRNRYEIFDPEYGVTEIQLNFDSSGMKLENLEGKRVTVSGFLLHSNSRYHYTEIIIDMDQIELTDE
jgi:hypothetical protein